jgi:hypothetical protein
MGGMAETGDARRLTSTLLVALLAVGLAACGGSGETSSTAGGLVLDPIGNQKVQPNRSLVLRLAASHTNDRHLVYSSTALPKNADLVPATGLFVFTPDGSQAGATYTVTFTVRDRDHQDSENVRIDVDSTVPPVNAGPELAPIGDHEVRAGSTLTIQQHATDPDGEPITFSAHPPLPPNATYDSRTGLFLFTPAADQIGVYPLSFVASDGSTVDYETVQIAVREQSASCPVTTPTGCVPLRTPTPTTAPGPSATPAPPGDLTIDQCYTVSSGSYTYHYVNVVDGGQLVFIDDGGLIDFRVSSLLVEQGGSVQAGALDCPFGAAGGKLEIGLWGTDPTYQGTVQNPMPAAIACVGGTTPGQCFAPSLSATPHYCVQPTPPATPAATWSPSDPCNVTVPGSDESAFGNAMFEGYDALNYDYSSNGIPNYFGYKVFGVSYGGSLQLFGRKGVRDVDLSPTPQTTCDTPENQYDLNEWAKLSGNSWARLDQPAAANAMTLTLDRTVDWGQGDLVVVGTTDWYPGHSEVVEVQSSSTSEGKTTLMLKGALAYAHSGQKYTVPPTLGAKSNNPNAEVELRAPVGLLSRSIVIYSLGATAEDPFPDSQSADWENCSYANNSGFPPAHPECYFGGHLMVRQGFDTFHLQGVEFHQLGQGGRQGHYPVHVHMVKSTDYTDAYVKDCSIWDSMDRFVVLHASHGVTVSRNVGFMSIGHGFYLEDGTEIENLLCHNLAVSVRGSFDEFFANQPPTSPSYRFVPPILDSTEQELSGGADAGDVFGGDTLFPVAFWTMNTWNELVGNAVAGVYGYGSCYWFLGSGVSGPSRDMMWSQNTGTPADYADFNVAGQQQAPVKRFRGNSCSGAAYGLQTTFEIQPTGNNAQQTGLSPATNPYIQCLPPSTFTPTPTPTGPTPTGSSTPATPTATPTSPDTCGLDQFDRPNVTGNFLPVKYSSTPGMAPNCASSYPLNPSNPTPPSNTNPDYCVTTVMDHFTTSFNHAGADFGAVWLRPLWFVFMNSAITDQLGGGLGFVTGGNWTESPAGYFSITENSVFVGSTQSDNPDAAPVGPALCPPGTPASTCAQNCTGAFCVLPAEGISLFTGGFNPKRMISIYDGPFYAEGSVFTHTEPLVCDPTGPAPFDDANGCQIYSSTTQPQYFPGVQSPTPTPTSSGSPYPTPTGTPPTPQLNVINAAVGWKQPNGFYYPPAFAFRKTAFDATTFRHNVIDQYATYLQSSPQNPIGYPTVYAPLGETFPGITPIDFSTILNDMDGSLTGWTPLLSPPPPTPGTRTSSVSQNAFFNAPSQDAECKSFGVQTSPYEFVSSVIAPVGGASPYFYVDAGVWGIATTPAVPIYRQLLLPNDQCLGDMSVCCAMNQPDCTYGSVGCTRGTFMLGGQGGQAPYLTANNGVYYIDTNKQEAGASCFEQAIFMQPGFAAGQAYVLYNLFANENTNVTYQLYVGDGFTGGQWVLVQPHVFNTDGTLGANDTLVTPITDAAVVTELNKGVTVTPAGILQAVFNHSAIGQSYLFSSKSASDVCLPRDICQIDTSTNSSCTIQAQPSFLDGNLTDYNDYKTDMTTICTYWATATAGRKSQPNTPGADQDDPIFADCPAGGCLGYMFTLPSGFTPKPYAAAGATLTSCFDAATWDIPMSSDDPDCSAPATPNPAAFCPSGPTPTATSTAATPASATPATGRTATAPATPAASTPTPTVTSTLIGTVSPTPTGTLTSTPNGTVTPSPTATVPEATPTPTLTPATTPTLIWLLNDTPVATLVDIPTGGQTYVQGTLELQDTGNRFCTSAGTFPALNVEVSPSNLQPIGVYPGNTSSVIDIADLPGVSAGTYDVLIQTFPACTPGPPTTLTMPNAIVYGPAPTPTP